MSRLEWRHGKGYVPVSKDHQEVLRLRKENENLRAVAHAARALTVAHAATVDAKEREREVMVFLCRLLHGWEP